MKTTVQLSVTETREVLDFLENYLKKQPVEAYDIDYLLLHRCRWWKWKRGGITTNCLWERLLAGEHSEVIEWIVSSWLRVKSINFTSGKLLGKTGKNGHNYENRKNSFKNSLLRFSEN